ncbi:MAG TPA: DNA polymerase Y family protein [Candidatus Polarisedimenticolia bacterium]|nr:DNA polymerase Y family protein [Candidatus Polarisedimenticolia bacterium]
MAFASIFVPNFMVQAVVRAEPSLRERALALVEGTPPLYRVAAINEKAARAGIEVGMSKTNAEEFAGLEIRPRSRAQEKSAHAALLDIGWSVSPQIEDTAEDMIVLDLAGLSYLFNSEEEIGVHLAQRASECGLLLNVAIAANVETAVIAARGFAGITVISPGEEAKRLADLPVGVVSPSAETAETLSRWGVHTCGALAALPVLQLSERLGQEGVRLHALARGTGSRSLAIAEPAHSFAEEMELDDAVEDLEPLSFLLGRLLDQLCARLTARSLAASVIRVRFELQPSPQSARDRRQEMWREKNSPTMYERELQLPVPVRDSKMLLKLLRLRLQANPPGAPIQKIALTAEVARPRATQDGLFLPSFPDPEKLEVTIARIAGVVGEGNVGSPTPVDTHRPGEFQMQRFLAAAEAVEAKRNDCGALQAGRQRRSSKVPASFRSFRPPVPAKLELEAGRPVRVVFQGLRGEVRAASGPWCTSGDWWREDPWQHEEWDVEIHFHFSGRRDPRVNPPPDGGLYCLYYDALRRSWFVRGIYD